MRNFKFEFDLFFISESFFNQHHVDLLNTLVVPKEEFKKNSSLSNIVNNSTYQTWNLSYDFVIVAEPGWYESLNDELLNRIQFELINNGHELFHNNHLVTARYWQHLNNDEQQAFIQQFDDEISTIDIQSFHQFPHLTQLHNTFPNEHGANCLSSTIFAITKHPFILEHWMHQKTFLLYLKRLGYFEVESSFSSGDVICFYQEEILTHACYVIDDEYVFNKQGQTFWEPWMIDKFESIQNHRNEVNYKIYSKLR